ncbi:unnamed protein product, partial [Musa acuminata subsp. burmannicoides]
VEQTRDGEPSVRLRIVEQSDGASIKFADHYGSTFFEPQGDVNDAPPKCVAHGNDSTDPCKIHGEFEAPEKKLTLFAFRLAVLEKAAGGPPWRLCHRALEEGLLVHHHHPPHRRRPHLQPEPRARVAAPGHLVPRRGRPVDLPSSQVQLPRPPPVTEVHLPAILDQHHENPEQCRPHDPRPTIARRSAAAAAADIAHLRRRPPPVPRPGLPLAERQPSPLLAAAARGLVMPLAHAHAAGGAELWRAEAGRPR